MTRVAMPSARTLAVHEAQVHAGDRRELRDLGHGLLLHDPADPEPFWNRLVAPEFPEDPVAFDRRLAETIVLFGTLGRYPHLRPLATGSEPPDLVDRLRANGFEVVGEDVTMVLRDPETVRRVATGDLPQGLSVDEPGEKTVNVAGVAREIAATLAAAFSVDPDREEMIERDARWTIGRRGVAFAVARLDGSAVAVAKRTSHRNMAYLSSIGTRPEMRGRGFGRLVTAAVADAAWAGGDRLVHLVVESDNGRAIRMYTSLGFEFVGRPVPDLLLRG